MTMTNGIVRGGWVVADAPNGELRVIENGAVYHVQGAIREIGTFDDLSRRYPQAPVVGSASHVVIPGLVNAHHHGYMSTYRCGGCDDPLETWLLNFFWRPTADPYLSTFLSGLTLLESGVTATLHCHYSKGSLSDYEQNIQRAIAGYKDSGIRVSFGPEITDRASWGVYEQNGEFVRTLPSHLQEAVKGFSAGDEKRIDATGYFRLIAKWSQQEQSDRVRIIMRPVVSHYCSDALLTEMRDRAKALGIGTHININETAYQRMFALRLYGESAFARLNRLGFLNPRVSCGHCVWVDDNDLRILAETGATVVSNPSSNLRLSSGIAPLVPMHERGIPIAIGIDSMGINDDEDMLQEMRMSLMLNRVPGHDRKSLTADEVFVMGTRNGARASFWDDQVGALKPGKRADIVLLDGKRLFEPFGTPRLSVLDDLLHLGRRGHVDIVLVEGEEVVRDGRALKGSSADISRQMAEQYDNDLKAQSTHIADRKKVCEEIMGYLRKYYASWGQLPGTPHYRFN